MLAVRRRPPYDYGDLAELAAEIEWHGPAPRPYGLPREARPGQVSQGTHKPLVVQLDGDEECLYVFPLWWELLVEP